MDQEKLIHEQKKELFAIVTPESELVPPAFRKSELNFSGEWKKRRKTVPKKMARFSAPSFGEKKSFFKNDKFKIELFELFIEFFCQEQPILLKDLMDNVEKSIIVNVLSKVQGNQKEAAKVLGIKYTTLNEKLKRYRIRFQKSPIDYTPRLI